LVFAEKRAKPLPLNVLKDPSSPNYVPYPYPKNEKEIIEDMKYAIKKMYIPREDINYVIEGPLPESHTILPNLLEENSAYKIGKIMKVKNLLSGHAHDYYWHIIILKEDDSIAAKVIMTANGLWGGTSSSYNNRKIYLNTDDEILSEFSVTLARNISKEEIKHIQAIELPPYIGTLFNPAYEVRLRNGEVYYYKSSEKAFYRIFKEIPWRKNKSG
jgi:hypothetical protein